MKLFGTISLNISSCMSLHHEGNFPKFFYQCLLPAFQSFAVWDSEEIRQFLSRFDTAEGGGGRALPLWQVVECFVNTDSTQYAGLVVFCSGWNLDLVNNTPAIYTVWSHNFRTVRYDCSINYLYTVWYVPAIFKSIPTI